MVSDRIFFGGFASGLDTAGIIDALIAVQSRPIVLAETRRDAIDERKTALNRINSSLGNLLARLADLKSPSIVGARSATTDQAPTELSKLSVSASSAAAVGSFTVDIVSLATATRLQSVAAAGQEVDQVSSLDQAGFDTPVVAGTFTIGTTEFTIPAATASTAESGSAVGSGVDLGVRLDAAGLTITPSASGTFRINGIDINFDSTADSLNTIIARINSSSAGVTASYDAASDELLLTSDTNGPALITFSDQSGNFLQAMNFVDGVGGVIATEVAGTDLVSLADVVSMINAAGIGVTATVVNDGDGRANLLQLSAASAIQLGSAGDTSNFLTVTHLLQSPAGSTRTSVRNMGVLAASATLQDARMETAFSQNAGTFEINGVEISYDSTVDSLSNIITRINLSAAGVTAAYDVQADALVLTSDSTGSVAMGLEDTAGNFLAAFGVLAATQSIGQNASYRVDGGALQYSTRNEVTNAVPGVTLTLKDETTGPITVTVSSDSGQLRSKIDGFVEQYNSTMSMIADLTEYDEDGDSGVLLGDSTVRNVERSLRSFVTRVGVGLSGDLRSLADIGLNFGAVGSAVGSTDLLLFDSATFSDALRDDPEAVGLLLTGFSASAALEAGGAGSLVSVSGTPTAVSDSGVYEFVLEPITATLTLTFRADSGATTVSTRTISPGEVNTTLIPGLTLTFGDPLVVGTDTVRVTAVQEGVAKSFHEYVDSLTRTGGVMAGRQSEMQARITDINEQIGRMETRLDERRERLIARFAAFEVTMQRLQNQQAALTNLVNQMSANRRSS